MKLVVDLHYARGAAMAYVMSLWQFDVEIWKLINSQFNSTQLNLVKSDSYYWCMTIF